LETQIRSTLDYATTPATSFKISDKAWLIEDEDNELVDARTVVSIQNQLERDAVREKNRLNKIIKANAKARKSMSRESLEDATRVGLGFFVLVIEENVVETVHGIGYRIGKIIYMLNNDNLVHTTTLLSTIQDKKWTFTAEWLLPVEEVGYNVFTARKFRCDAVNGVKAEELKAYPGASILLCPVMSFSDGVYTLEEQQWRFTLNHINSLVASQGGASISTVAAPSNLPCRHRVRAKHNNCGPFLYGYILRKATKYYVVKFDDNTEGRGIRRESIQIAEDPPVFNVGDVVEGQYLAMTQKSNRKDWYLGEIIARNPVTIDDVTILGHYAYDVKYADDGKVDAGMYGDYIRYPEQ
jgi:hypothetical protein